MSDQNDDLDLDQDEEVIDDESVDNESEESESKPPRSNEDKRVSDLQSKADKAEARANKAEAALAKALNRGEGDASGSNDPERAALMQELREASLDAVYGEFAELKAFDIDRALIEGTTRAEMRESATSLVSLVKSVETKVRNRVLREHGIKAEPAGGQRQPPKDFGAMGEEDFEKVLARVKSGGDPVW